MRLNPQKGKNAITQVGADILIPGEFNADSYPMRVRKSKAESLKKYSQFEARRLAKEINSGDVENVKLAKSYNNVYEFAKDKLLKSGIKNPNNGQINKEANLQQFEGAQKNIEYLIEKYPDNTELKEVFEKAKSYQDNWLNYVDAFDENGKLKTGAEYDKYRNQTVEAESFRRGDIVAEEYRKIVGENITPRTKTETKIETIKQLTQEEINNLKASDPNSAKFVELVKSGK